MKFLLIAAGLLALGLATGCNEDVVTSDRLPTPGDAIAACQSSVASHFPESLDSLVFWEGKTVNMDAYINVTGRFTVHGKEGSYSCAVGPQSHVFDYSIATPTGGTGG